MPVAFALVSFALRGSTIGSEVSQWIGTSIAKMPTTVKPTFALVGAVVVTKLDIRGPDVVADDRREQHRVETVQGASVDTEEGA
jgi:hypothetical protein